MGPLTLPPGAMRLFDPQAEVLPAAEVIPRLLEAGDRADLRWLAAACGEPALRSWFADHGGRRLSRRGRAFWSLVLATSPNPSHPLAEELWPL